MGKSCHHRLCALRPLFKPIHKCFILVAFRVARRRSLSTLLLNWDPSLAQCQQPPFSAARLPTSRARFKLSLQLRSPFFVLKYQLSTLESSIAGV
ncbi:uncharacterized protein K444DRAFT_347862 [Hyaloscypha bicolor E]|uniref:Uncharacterized protein n=1 Tax=Hyaloscypha bicolor E TaxID=1095630 RepID=A0A2J6TI49_9HELO|nr:uncharacterized protein K444DRAFT_347862 [Hyaloscypha bicolor E]PMD62696.1 hypothetical protein K444DRAFT_347862 [Hyaloscypha bicolor E]